MKNEPIVAVLFKDPQAFILHEVADMEVDNFCAVHPRGRMTEDGRVYFDEEESVSKHCSMDEHVEALRKMVQLIDNQELFVGGIKCSLELTDPCNWDVEVFDAFNQLVYHGEVIYG